MVRFGYLLLLSMAGARVLEHRFAHVFAVRQRVLARSLMTMVPLKVVLAAADWSTRSGTSRCEHVEFADAADDASC